MDIFLLILALVCLITGFVGSIVPALPGPPLSWVGLLLLKFSRFGAGITWSWVFIFALVVILVTILDYVIPVWGTRKFGGTKAGIWGTTIGLFVGLFWSPAGIILGPFIGAFIGELLAGNTGQHSFKAAFGSFIGFLLGVGLKLIVCTWIAGYCLVQLF